MLPTPNRATFVVWEFTHKLGHINMNSTELKGNWNEQKGKLMKKFAELTDNDLLFEEGKKEEMLGKLQLKLGKTKEQIQEIIETF